MRRGTLSVETHEAEETTVRHSDEDLHAMRAHGPSGGTGEARALLDELISARAEIARQSRLLEHPEVAATLARIQREGAAGRSTPSAPEASAPEVAAEDQCGMVAPNGEICRRHEDHPLGPDWESVRHEWEDERGMREDGPMADR